MRTITAGVLAGLDTPGHLVTVTRTDGTIVRLTDIGVNATVGGNTYLGRPGCTVNSIAMEASGSASTLDIDLPVGGRSPITMADMVAGFYDHASVTVDIFSWADEAAGSDRLAIGIIANVDYSDARNVRFDIIGIWGRTIMMRMRTYGPVCGTELGHPLWCKMPILPDDVERSTAYALGDFVRFSDDGTASGYGDRNFECTTAGTTAGTAPTFDYTVGNTTTDGTAVWTAREAWTRYATVTHVVSALSFRIAVTESRAVEDWFTRGAGRFINGPGGGANANRAFDVRKWRTATSRVDLWVPLPGVIEVGDELEIHVGDDLTMETCRDRFDNLLHFQGFPHLPDVPFGGVPDE